jgi:hypothetical protein
LVRPVIVVLVAGGEPDTVTGVCATPPMYGVTVYFVIWLPPLGGAVHVTLALPSPAVAETPVGADGGVRAGAMSMNEATDGTPWSSTMNSM